MRLDEVTRLESIPVLGTGFPFIHAFLYLRAS